MRNVEFINVAGDVKSVLAYTKTAKAQISLRIVQADLSLRCSVGRRLNPVDRSYET